MPQAAPHPVPDDILLVHLTDLTNLASISQTGGLICYTKQVSEGIQHTSISYSSIQEKRERTLVTCGPGGGLHDYVPMFFCTRPPMLYTISRGNVAGRSQDTIVYLCTTLADIESAGCDFVFTDGHGIMRTTRFLGQRSDLDQVDWPLMTARWWNDTQEDPDRARRRQAEFLVHQFLPLSALRGAVVRDAATQDLATAVLAAHGIRLPVSVRAAWYY